MIRVYTLSFVDKLMKTDPEMYLQNKWTARVFLMVHDPAVSWRKELVRGALLLSGFGRGGGCRRKPRFVRAEGINLS